jgi:hypothetical protein
LPAYFILTEKKKAEKSAGQKKLILSNRRLLMLAKATTQRGNCPFAKKLTLHYQRPLPIMIILPRNDSYKQT